MKTIIAQWLIILVASAAVLCLGCQPAKTTPKSEPVKTPAAVAAAKQKPSKEASSAAKQAAKQAEKRVVLTSKLSEEDRATCLVQVGDSLPETSLPDLQGTPQSLKSLYGKRLTFVCFWTAGDSQRSTLKAQEMLESLGADLAQPFAGQGVRVIAVNVADKPEAVQRMTDQAKVKYPCLLDPDGAFFAKVATKLLPRIYLLDAEGKILWFDREYSGKFFRDNVVPAVKDMLAQDEKR